MPRLNHGTLLENLVVLEVTRVLATAAESSLEFASAFAMPPLTQCWHKTQKEYEKNNPKFNADVMANLLNGVYPAGPPDSYSALLRICLQNSPGLRVVKYALRDAWKDYQFGGPNGALLAAMLRRRHGQTVRIWSNDLSSTRCRYNMPIACSAASECPRTNDHADALLNRSAKAEGGDAFCSKSFPDSVSALAAWRNACTVRIGFLDPDSYVAEKSADEGQTDSRGHVSWLTNLYQDALCAAGLMFFACQDAPSRPALIDSFHQDAVREYPRSVVFSHGNYMVGVKLHCDDRDAMPLIISSVQNAWAAWSTMVDCATGGLSSYVDGQT